jgi:hypothetical protein
MSKKEERPDDMEKRLCEALRAAGLKEEQLGLLATEPHIAKEAADAISDALKRRARREESPRSIAGDIDLGGNSSFFW